MIKGIETITYAAIKEGHSGKLYLGYRHYLIIREMGGSHHPDEQGFVTSKRRFVDRVEALQIALAAGQLIRTPNGSILTSEDVW